MKYISLPSEYLDHMVVKNLQGEYIHDIRIKALRWLRKMGKISTADESVRPVVELDADKEIYKITY